MVVFRRLFLCAARSFFNPFQHLFAGQLDFLQKLPRRHPARALSVNDDLLQRVGGRYRHIGFFPDFMDGFFDILVSRLRFLRKDDVNIMIIENAFLPAFHTVSVEDEDQRAAVKALVIAQNIHQEVPGAFDINLRKLAQHFPGKNDIIAVNQKIAFPRLAPIRLCRTGAFHQASWGCFFPVALLIALFALRLAVLIIGALENFFQLFFADKGFRRLFSFPDKIFCVAALGYPGRFFFVCTAFFRRQRNRFEVHIILYLIP